LFHEALAPQGARKLCIEDFTWACSLNPKGPSKGGRVILDEEEIKRESRRKQAEQGIQVIGRL
jgi:hypothetical protein